MSAGTCSVRYLTTASGPSFTWRPCGNARVFTLGLTSLASASTFELCSGVHIDAVNYMYVSRLAVWSIADISIPRRLASPPRISLSRLRDLRALESVSQLMVQALDLLSALAAYIILYSSFKFSTTRPTIRCALSGALFTVTSL